MFVPLQSWLYFDLGLNQTQGYIIAFPSLMLGLNEFVCIERPMFSMYLALYINNDFSSRSE